MPEKSLPAWRRYLLPGFVFALVALASLAAAAALRQSALERDRARFETETRLAEAKLVERIETHTAILRAGAGFLAASEDVNAFEFDTFVRRLGISTRYPGVLGIGYSEQAIGEAERSALVNRRRAERGFGNFRVWPQEPRPEYHSILFLSPLGRRNLAAIGYDMFTEPTRRAAMEQARDSGRSVASNRVTLVQEIDEAKQPGFLIYTPVYEGGMIPGTVEARRRLLQGFVYSPLRAYDLFGTVFPPGPARLIDLAIYAGPPTPDNLLFQTGAMDSNGDRRAVRPVKVAQRPWTVVYSATPAFAADSRVHYADWAAGAGLLMALLLAFATASREKARLSLREANADLERRVEERTAALRLEMERRESAEGQVRQMQKMEAVGQLTGGIAHDFNNMLAIVIGSLDMAKRRKDPERVAKLIDRALEGAGRAAALTQRLLAFSRRQPLAPQAVDANALLAGMSDLVRRTLGETVALETKPADGLWLTYVDPGQLENAVVNLAVNARDAMPEGGSLTIGTANSRIDDHPDAPPGDYVSLMVADTGAGMAPDVLDKAFDPFFTTKEVGKGTGLGLSQVFGFVKQSGGHIDIRSEPGEGTAVTLYLPRYEGAERPAGRTERPAADLPRGTPEELVLVVEDEEDVRLTSVEALRELGYTVIHAGDGEEALAKLDGHQGVRLLFTDVVMPGMNGRQLADEARRRWPGLKLLFTTGYARDAIVQDGVIDRDIAFLPKPFSVEELAAKVRAALDAPAQGK